MRKTKKNNHRDKRRHALKENYYDRYWKWYRRKPPKWRIFAWIRWKSEEPKMPKWLKEQQMGGD